MDIPCPTAVAQPLLSRDLPSSTLCMTLLPVDKIRPMDMLDMGKGLSVTIFPAELWEPGHPQEQPMACSPA